MRLVDADKFLERVKKDREHEIYLHSWTADMVLERLDSWYAPTVEAIPKADYETRLKADLVAMLEEIDLQFDEICFCRKAEWKTVPEIKAEYKAVIHQKINALKENNHDD